MAFGTLRCGQVPSGTDSTTLTSLTMLTNPPYSPSSPSLQNADNFQTKVPKQCVLVRAVRDVREVRDVGVAREVRAIRAVRDVQNAQVIPSIQKGVYPHSRLKRISRCSESSKRNEHSEFSARNKKGHRQYLLYGRARTDKAMRSKTKDSSVRRDLRRGQGGRTATVFAIRCCSNRQSYGLKGLERFRSTEIEIATNPVLSARLERIRYRLPLKLLEQVIFWRCICEYQVPRQQL